MKEDKLQIAICKYVRLQYPKVLFNSDMSGIRLPMGLAIKVKKMRSSRAYPDLMIFETNSKHCGLFIELKVKTPFKKNGELLKSEHLLEQSEMIKELNKRGYKASFCWTFEQAIKEIDDYLLIKR